MLTTGKIEDLRIKDYDSFGMITFGRSWEAGSGHRYGFNTQEQDDEVYGNGNLNSAEFWEYDTRLGRRSNLDPIKQPWQTQYVSLNNSPISFADFKGDIASISTAPTDVNGKPTRQDLKLMRKILWVITFQYNDTHFDKWYAKRQFKNKCCGQFTGKSNCKTPFRRFAPISRDEKIKGGADVIFENSAMTKEFTTYDLDIIATGDESGMQANNVFDQTYNLDQNANYSINTNAYAVSDEFIITDCNTGNIIYTSPARSETGQNTILVPPGTTCIRVVVNPNPGGGTRYKFDIINTSTPVAKTVKTYKWRIFRTSKVDSVETWQINGNYRKRIRYY